MLEYDLGCYLDEDKIVPSCTPNIVLKVFDAVKKKQCISAIAGLMLRLEYSRVPTFDEDDLETFDYREPMEDRMGMTVTSGTVSIQKDDSNLIGISIGGGAPNCICLYIVQVFDNTPTAKSGVLQSGDEITAVNGESVKNKTKVEVAKMIQNVKGEVTITYNKLHADPKQGKTLDIVLKKAKHRMVENMSVTTADALGLSRAILCNDSLLKKLQELERNEFVYKGLVDHTRKMLKAFFDICQVYKAFGDVFAGIGVREPQPRASEAFTQFGEAHRTMEKFGIKFLKAIKPMLTDLGTYLHKAIPDTKLTIKKYADVKFEYLSYCLKVKEMDDEEYAYHSLQEPLYRVETGNYEYRLILRCRQEARVRFLKLRSDVLVKLELLDQKHVQDIVFQMNRLLAALAQYHEQCCELMTDTKVFPIELDLPQSTFQYTEVMPSGPKPYCDEDDEREELDDDEDLIMGQEAKEELIPLSPSDTTKPPHPGDFAGGLFTSNLHELDKELSLPFNLPVEDSQEGATGLNLLHD